MRRSCAERRATKKNPRRWSCPLGRTSAIGPRRRSRRRSTAGASRRARGHRGPCSFSKNPARLLVAHKVDQVTAISAEGGLARPQARRHRGPACIGFELGVWRPGNILPPNSPLVSESRRTVRGKEPSAWPGDGSPVPLRPRCERPGQGEIRQGGPGDREGGALAKRRPRTGGRARGTEGRLEIGLPGGRGGGLAVQDAGAHGIGARNCGRPT